MVKQCRLLLLALFVCQNITLIGVLYVPILHCNLLLVLQFIDDLHCIVQLNAYRTITKELIGTGARRDGLYYFSKSDSVHHVSAIVAKSDLELWHRPHPSEKVVKLLPTVSSKDYLDK